MTESLIKLIIPGKHTRPQGPEELRRICIAALIMLVLQYGLGIYLNLYATVPAADAHSAIIQEIERGPVSLTIHASLGVLLILCAVLLVIRAVSIRNWRIVALTALGLGSIGGAFISGEIFVKNGADSASFSMALFTALAFLSYIGSIALVTVARRQGTPGSPAVAPQAAAAGHLPHRAAPGAQASFSGQPGQRAYPGQHAQHAQPRHDLAGGPRQGMTGPQAMTGQQGWPSRSAGRSQAPWADSE